MYYFIFNFTTFFLWLFFIFHLINTTIVQRFRVSELHRIIQCLWQLSTKRIIVWSRGSRNFQRHKKIYGKNYVGARSLSFGKFERSGAEQAEGLQNLASKRCCCFFQMAGGQAPLHPPLVGFSIRHGHGSLLNTAQSMYVAQFEPLLYKNLHNSAIFGPIWPKFLLELT